MNDAFNAMIETEETLTQGPDALKWLLYFKLKQLQPSLKICSVWMLLQRLAIWKTLLVTAQLTFMIRWLWNTHARHLILLIYWQVLSWSNSVPIFMSCASYAVNFFIFRLALTHYRQKSCLIGWYWMSEHLFNSFLGYATGFSVNWNAASCLLTKVW